VRSPVCACLAAGTLTVVAATAIVVAASTPTVGAGATTAAPTTVAATTTAVTTTVPPTTSPPSLPPPADEESDPVAALVPSIVAFDEVLDDPVERQAAVATSLTELQNTVATEEPPQTLCAVVPVAAPLMAAGRWELDGEPLTTSPELRRDPPGYGDCLDREAVEGFDEGVYQYVATGPTGARSAAVTFVLGVPSVAVWLLNNGDQPICLVQASPHAADFYESFTADSELLPGEALAIRMASVDHDLRIFGCPPDDVVRSLDVEPRFGVYVALFWDEETDDSAPPPAPAGTAATTTTG
jgi:hypothetical protein